MRIAIAADDARGLDSVAAHHFGRCPYYVFVDIEGDDIKAVEVFENPYFNNHSPGTVPVFIQEHKAEVMIAGGMGRRAIALFEQYGIQPYTGAAGTVRRALEQYHGGALVDAQPCSHDDEGHEHGHDHAEGEGHEGEEGEIKRLREEVSALKQQIEDAAARLG
ncbi:MAG: NifB/NifX family molybdenum-iron cluster-binding protein [Anaerolineae bacterium]|nr:NifB/NifX family molybdenum-iron cluster-binding protein [Anaerolineae bacterium]